MDKKLGPLERKQWLFIAGGIILAYLAYRWYANYSANAAANEAAALETPSATTGSTSADGGSDTGTDTTSDNGLGPIDPTTNIPYALEGLEESQGAITPQQLAGLGLTIAPSDWEEELQSWETLATSGGSGSPAPPGSSGSATVTNNTPAPPAPVVAPAPAPVINWAAINAPFLAPGAVAPSYLLVPPKNAPPSARWSGPTSPGKAWNGIGGGWWVPKV